MNEKPLFPYDPQALTHLCQCDEKLKAYIEKTGPIERPITPNLFEALVGSIISQQISGQAAETVFARLKKLVGEVTSKTVEIESEERIQQCGMSRRKASYIKAAAKADLEGRLPKNMAELDDETIIAFLDELPGIGRWTAEMLLIFSLGRQNVLSYDDLGIRRGLMKLHGLSELSKDDFNRFRELYSPYCSLASLYLWHIAAKR